MKKIYYIIVGLCVVIFAYWIITALPTFSQKVKTIAVDSLNDSSFSSYGNFGFKITSERQELINAMININSNFIKNPPRKFNQENNSIKNFYKLEKFFSEFKYYYISKIKITNILTEDLPKLYSETSSLSETNLQEYFKRNATNLSENWGINDFNGFSDLVYTLKQIEGQKITSYELEDSYFYDPTFNQLNFRIEISLENNSSIYIGVLLEPSLTTTPTIKFYGTASGGFSYV